MSSLSIVTRIKSKADYSTNSKLFGGKEPNNYFDFEISANRDKFCLLRWAILPHTGRHPFQHIKQLIQSYLKTPNRFNPNI